MDCLYNKIVECCDTSGCKTCGWNPHDGVRERRVRRALREYRRERRAGIPHLKKENKYE